jgi:hypothetical protein
LSVAGSHDPSPHVAPAQHVAPAVPHAAHVLLAQTLPAWHCPAQQGWPFWPHPHDPKRSHVAVPLQVAPMPMHLSVVGSQHSKALHPLPGLPVAGFAQQGSPLAPHATH